MLKKLRKHSIWIIEGVLFVAIFFAVSAFQARNLLATDRQAAPELKAELLHGGSFDLTTMGPKPALVYFFAPWCRICAASSDNIRRLRRIRDEEKLAIVVVALDWQREEEVRQYVEKHRLNVPVVLGDLKITNDWKVIGFPTYYVLDDEQRVVSRDYGYSTQLGLWWRSWL